MIGKGGMGAKTLAALKEHGAVYLNAIGGAAQFYARAIKKVDDVSLLEFGTPEAMWHLEVEDFPAIVTMDAHGNSLHKDIEQESGPAPRDDRRIRKNRGNRRAAEKIFLLKTIPSVLCALRGFFFIRHVSWPRAGCVLIGMDDSADTGASGPFEARYLAFLETITPAPAQPAPLLLAHDRIRRSTAKTSCRRRCSRPIASSTRSTTSVRWRRGCFASRTIAASTSCAAAACAKRRRLAAMEPDVG